MTGPAYAVIDPRDAHEIERFWTRGAAKEYAQWLACSVCHSFRAYGITPRVRKVA